MKPAMFVVLVLSIVMNLILGVSLNRSREQTVQAVEDHRKTIEQNKAYRDEIDKFFAEYNTKVDSVIAGYQKLLAEQIARQNKSRP